MLFSPHLWVFGQSLCFSLSHTHRRNVASTMHLLDADDAQARHTDLHRCPAVLHRRDSRSNAQGETGWKRGSGHSDPSPSAGLSCLGSGQPELWARGSRKHSQTSPVRTKTNTVFCSVGSAGNLATKRSPLTVLVRFGGTICAAGRPGHFAIKRTRLSIMEKFGAVTNAYILRYI